MPIASSPRIADPVIRMQNIAVRYRLPQERLSGIKEYIIRWLQRRLKYDDFWALQNVCFQVQKGEIFGVIGQNGAGKSTLLKVMARVLNPTQGRVVIHGKVAPLLELGGGFHPELTGRENIFLNSALLGRSKSQTESLFDSIVDFAEIWDFIDAPLRTYSTGMSARLGFSVATCLRPDILLIDEVLSVGDVLFQKKCLDRMYDFREAGTTIVIVTHSMATIEGFCDRTLWLSAGQVKMIGPVSEVAPKYVQMELPRKNLDRPDAEQVMPPRLEMSTPQAEPLNDQSSNYVSFPALEHVYPTAEILNFPAGSVSLWLKFLSKETQHTAILFHTDDSRFVIYADLDPESGHCRIVARAGGNRQVLDPIYGSAKFPEVIAILDDTKTSGESLPWENWNLITMTWNGFPAGVVSLFCNDKKIGATEYSRFHDNHYRWPLQLAVGIRPREWMGELIQRHDGTFTELHPQTTSSITGSGKEIRDVRLYPVALSPDQIKSMLVSG
jgi:lipopolysaccharide transport system ATP-binding protein